jgi:hypothetical protein
MAGQGVERQKDDWAVTGTNAIALLHDLNCWREQLARSIARNNHGLTSDTIAAATNRIIGRLLFLRIAEDRGIIPAGTLRQIETAADPLSAIFAFFLQSNDPWNETPVTGRHQTTAFVPVVPEDRVIQKILLRLCEPNDCRGV